MFKRRFSLYRRLLSMKFDSGVAYMMAESYVEQGKLLEAKLLFERLALESDSFYKIHYVSFHSITIPILN